MKGIGAVLLWFFAFFRLGTWSGDRQVAFSLCSELEKAPFARVTGSPIRVGSGRWRLGEPTIDFSDRLADPIAFTGEVFIDDAFTFADAHSGRQIQFEGPLRCRPALRNPGRVDDGRFFYHLPRITLSSERFRIRLVTDSATFGSRIQSRFSNWLDRTCVHSPGLSALARAVWLGDGSGFPTSMADFYKEGGLLQILALSGQHVGALVLVGALSLKIVVRICFACGWYRLPGRGLKFASAILPLAGCAVLYVTSGGAPPVQRTFGMLVGSLLLRARGFRTSPLQATASCVAVFLIWNPSLLFSPSFFLSAAATALLHCIGEAGGLTTAFAQYAILSLVMPILVFPLSAFFFCKLSLVSPIHTLVLGWIWSLVLIPGGFVLPFWLAVLPEPIARAFGDGFESAWRWGLRVQDLWIAAVPTGYINCVRPTWFEYLFTETILVIGAVRLLAWVQVPTRR